MAVERPGTLAEALSAVSELVWWWPLLTVESGFVEVHLLSARVPFGVVLEVAVKYHHESPATLEGSHK